MKRATTPDENRAIAALQKVAKIWPKTLILIKHGDSCTIEVKHVADHPDDPAMAESLASVAIRSDACA